MRLRKRGLAFLFSAIVAAAVVTPVLQLAQSSPAAASSTTSAPAPQCPPECGRVAAGDALLVPYITSNPGPDWLSLPDTSVQSYVNELRQELERPSNGTVTNVAAARFDWITGQHQLLVVLVSSSSLTKLRLENLRVDAQDLCEVSRGIPEGALKPVPGVKTSVYGECVFPRGSSQFAGATIVSFMRANVAGLLLITSTNDISLPLSTITIATQIQYSDLPSGGVLVSNGSDLELELIWLLILATVIFCVVRCARRRGTWRGPFDAIGEAFGRRKIALGVTVLGVAGAMAFAMLDWSLLHGSGQWFNAKFGDLWASWASSADMTFGGGYGHIYLLDGGLETAPTIQVLLAPVARTAFNLSFPYPGVVLYPTAFLVVGPLFLACMALPICAADRWMSYMGVTDLGRRVLVLGTLAVALPPIALYGHAEDMLALGAMLYGLVASLDGRHRAAGWWLGAALAFQFLAFLAVPIALVLLRRRQWTGAIVRMIVVPLSVMVVPLAIEPKATLLQIFHQKVYDDFGYISPTWHLDPGVGSIIRAVVALAAIPAALIVARRLPGDREGAANLVIWALGALLALRVLEPELVPYFLAPALALAPVSASRSPWWRLAPACAGAVWLTWWLHAPTFGRLLPWLLLVAQLCVLGWLAFPRASQQSDEDPKSPPVERPARSPAARRPRGPATARVG
jgi:hypothetical protein